MTQLIRGVISLGDKWRQISYPINLSFPLNLQPNQGSSYDWILENAETTILQFFLEHPGSKGAVILNSIAAVKKLSGHFKQIFERGSRYGKILA